MKLLLGIGVLIFIGFIIKYGWEHDLPIVPVVVLLLFLLGALY